MPEGGYFETHKVAGEVVTRRIEVDLKRYGYGGPQLEQNEGRLSFLEVTVPVFRKTGLYVMRTLVHERPLTDGEKNKPRHTLVMLGGGASEALGNSKWVADTLDILDGMRDMPFVVDRIVMLPHVPGSLRVEDSPRKKWEDVYGEYAEVHKEVLDANEVRSPHEAGRTVIGYSTGGLQAVELAAKLGPNCDLVLIESGGLADHSQFELLMQVGVGVPVRAFEKALRQGLRPWPGIKKAVKEVIGAIRGSVGEIERSWKVPHGSSSIGAIAMWMLTGGDDRWMGSLARAYGIDSRTRGDIFFPELTSDSTEKARNKVSGAVVMSFAKLERVVNSVAVRLMGKFPDRYTSYKGIAAMDEGIFLSDAWEVARELFPNSAGVETVVFEGSHTSPMADTKVLKRIMGMWGEMQGRAGEIGKFKGGKN